MTHDIPETGVLAVPVKTVVQHLQAGSTEGSGYFSMQKYLPPGAQGFSINDCATNFGIGREYVALTCRQTLESFGAVLNWPDHDPEIGDKPALLGGTLLWIQAAAYHRFFPEDKQADKFLNVSEVILAGTIPRKCFVVVKKEQFMQARRERDYLFLPNSWPVLKKPYNPFHIRLDQ